MNEKKLPNKYNVNIGGIILVFVGLLFLLQNFGFLSFRLWDVLWRFWPVILVVAGINIIVGRHKPWLAAVIVLVVLGAVLLLSLWIYPDHKEEIVRYSVPAVDLQEAVVELDIRAEDIDLSALPAGSPDLAKTSSQRDRLSMNLNHRDKVGFLRLESSRIQRAPWWGIGTRWTQSRVELSRDIPLTIKAQLYAVKAEIDLSHLRAARLDVFLNAGSATVKMPSDVEVMHAFIEGNAANIEIMIPEGVAARIEVDVNAGILEIDENRFVRKGAYYISPDFDNAESRLYMEIDMNAGRVNVL